MNTRPPPYNPYMYSYPPPQLNNSIPTAPPMEDFQDVPIRYPPPIMRIHHLEQYRQNEQKQHDNECCCFGILTILCCCL